MQNPISKKSLRKTGAKQETQIVEKSSANYRYQHYSFSNKFIGSIYLFDFRCSNPVGYCS